MLTFDISRIIIGVEDRHQWESRPASIFCRELWTCSFSARCSQAMPMHGWAISERIRQVSENVLHANQGSLYPALHRLEHQGWIKAEWGVSELGRRARFYRLTASGRKQLQQEADNWTRVAGAIGKVLELA